VSAVKFYSYGVVIPIKINEGTKMINDITFSNLKDFASNHPIELFFLGASIFTFYLHIGAGCFTMAGAVLVAAITLSDTLNQAPHNDTDLGGIIPNFRL
jgi:hypothetical protein